MIENDVASIEVTDIIEMYRDVVTDRGVTAKSMNGALDMSPQLDQVFQAALALPETERAALVESLIATLTHEQSPLDEAWMREIERRTADIDAGKAEMTPWEVVRARVHAQVFGRE